MVAKQHERQVTVTFTPALGSGVLRGGDCHLLQYYSLAWIVTLPLLVSTVSWAPPPLMPPTI